MPGRITELSETQIIADMRAELRRLRAAVAASQEPTWAHDRFVVAGTPLTTYQLTSIPYGINVLSKTASGGTTSLVLAEGTDFTVDYSTGVVTLTATPTSADVIFVSYVTNGDLIALTGTADTGVGAPTSLSHLGASGNSTSPSGSMPATFAAGDLLIAALALALPGATVTVEPSGWTLVASTSFLRVYKRVATGSETTVGWTISGAQGWNMEVRAFRGTSGTPAVDTSGTGTQHLGTSAPVPVLTSAGTRLELGYWAVQKTAIVNPVSPPGGWTNSNFVVAAGTGGVLVAEKSVSAGSTSADTATSTGEDDWNMIALVLNGPL